MGTYIQFEHNVKSPVVSIKLFAWMDTCKVHTHLQCNYRNCDATNLLKMQLWV